MKNSCEELVSIITPMYNAQDTISDTIRSVIRQTYKNWEMIIVDDCSKDNSAKIADEYQRWDPRIKLVKNYCNMGVVMGRNEALEQASGRFIAFLDSDDRWNPSKLQKQISYMIENNVAFSYTACNIIDEDGEYTGKCRKVPKSVNYKKLLGGNDIPCLTVILDKNVVGDIRFKEIRHEDYALWLDILKTGITASGIQEPLSDYRVKKKSLSGNKMRSLAWTWNIYRKHLKFGRIKSCFCFVNYLSRAIAKRI